MQSGPLEFLEEKLEDAAGSILYGKMYSDLCDWAHGGNSGFISFKLAYALRFPEIAVSLHCLNHSNSPVSSASNTWHLPLLKYSRHADWALTNITAIQLADGLY